METEMHFQEVRKALNIVWQLFFPLLQRSTCVQSAHI